MYSVLNQASLSLSKTAFDFEMPSREKSWMRSSDAEYFPIFAWALTRAGGPAEKSEEVAEGFGDDAHFFIGNDRCSSVAFRQARFVRAEDERHVCKRGQRKRRAPGIAAPAWACWICGRRRG